jgi:hypothetical protein
MQRPGAKRVFELVAEIGGDLGDEGPAIQLPPAESFASVAGEKETLVRLFHAFAHDDGRGLIYDLEIERGERFLRRPRLADGFSAYFEQTPFTTGEARPVLHLYIECSYVWRPMAAIPESGLLARPDYA